jgi:rhodanese-related sulfurtransferase
VPSPPEDDEPAVLTCDEMRESAGAANALLLALAAGVIAWVVIGH